MTRPPVRARVFVRIAADIIGVPPAMILRPHGGPYIEAARRIGMAAAYRHGHSAAAVARAFRRDCGAVRLAAEREAASP